MRILVAEKNSSIREYQLTSATSVVLLLVVFKFL
jgi:hypothetical protein